MESTEIVRDIKTETCRLLWTNCDNIDPDSATPEWYRQTMRRNRRAYLDSSLKKTALYGENNAYLEILAELGIPIPAQDLLYKVLDEATPFCASDAHDEALHQW